MAPEPPIVETLAGKVRGRWVGDVAAFKSIPYADTTAGGGRFRPPRPAVPWAGVRDALDWGPSAPQPEGRLNDRPTSEDCLGLNVWTQAVTGGGKRPVMVWLHGGGFNSGTASRPYSEGARLAKRGDVVVVSLNHRLNVFGFLNLAALGGSDFAQSGNVGMLDIVQALEWVRDNIEAFGGDPDCVTLFGESGGGGKVSVLMAMPRARGLFHRAIIQSGSHLTGLSVEESTQNARLVLEAVGGDLAALLGAPTAGVLDAMSAAQRVKGRRRANFSPVADGDILPGQPWLEGAPAISAHIPVVIGSTRTEMTYVFDLIDPGAFELDEADLPAKLKPWVPAGDIDRIIEVYRRAHPGAGPSDLLFLISSAARMRHQGWVMADKRLQAGGAPVYMYELHFDQDARMRSPHAMDIPIVFDNIAAYALAPPEAQTVADQMASAWIAFGRTGDPNNGHIPHWRPYTLPEGAVMLFNPDPRLALGWRAAERAAFDSIPVMRVDR